MNPELTEMVDAAMVEMKSIVPPLRRSDCERLIVAALAVQRPPKLKLVGSISRLHVPRQQTEPWCREILLYSPKNQGDGGLENRVPVYTPVKDL